MLPMKEPVKNICPQRFEITRGQRNPDELAEPPNLSLTVMMELLDEEATDRETEQLEASSTREDGLQDPRAPVQTIVQVVCSFTGFKTQHGSSGRASPSSCALQDIGCSAKCNPLVGQ